LTTQYTTHKHVHIYFAKQKKIRIILENLAEETQKMERIFMGLRDDNIDIPKNTNPSC